MGSLVISIAVVACVVFLLWQFFVRDVVDEE